MHLDEFGHEVRRHFGSPKIPKPEPPPEEVKTKPPKVQDKAVQEAQSEALRRRKMARNYRSTVLSRDLFSDQAAEKLGTLGS